MKQIDVGQVSQVLANVGVMLGIVFLAIEVRQNQATLEEQNTLTTLAARDGALDNFSRFRILLLENPSLHALWLKGRDDEPLSDVEGDQFLTLCLEDTYGRLSVYNRFSALGEVLEVEALVRRMATQLMESARHTECWQTLRGLIAAQGHNSFVSAIDQAIERL